jgi:FkbM family methyltransferase
MFQTAARILGLIWHHPSNEGARLAGVVRSVLWQAQKRLGISAEAKVGDLRIRCYPDSEDASRVVYFKGIPDPNEMLFLNHYLRPGDNVIDAGANIGIYTLHLAQLVAPGRVLSFEPDAKSAERLQENVRLNKLTNVTIRQAAVSDFHGVATFTAGDDTAGAFSDLRASEATQRVEVVRLADEMGTLKWAPAKLDVEGAEPAALRRAMLESHNPPVWLIELTRRTLSRSGTSLESVRATLNALGYSLWSYDPGTRQLKEWFERPRQPGKVGDAIAIANAKLEDVRDRISGDKGVDT